MQKEVGAFEAKTHLSKLLDWVEEGQSVYITRRGVRIAQLVPPRPERRRKGRRGSARGKDFYMAPDFDEPLEAFKDYQ